MKACQIRRSLGHPGKSESTTGRPSAPSYATTLLGMMLGVFLIQLSSPAATTNLFFNATQRATQTASNITSVTLQSEGYLFTYSQDGYFTGGLGGGPIGRFFSVVWPGGVEAQASTAGPLLGTGANISIQRVDGKRFDLQSFTGKILLNTAGAGGAFEVMPRFQGNDAFPDPLQFDCTGYTGQSFPYAPMLSGYDTYSFHMWGDFALTSLLLTDTNQVVPVAQFTNSISATIFPEGAGLVSGTGDFPSNTTCTLTASPSDGWGFQGWTEQGKAVSSSPTYSFVVRSNRTLVANFVPAYTIHTDIDPGYGGSTSGAGIYHSNTTVTVRAVAAPGFRFLHWTDGGTPLSTSLDYSFPATANVSLVAVFIFQPQTSLIDFDTSWPSLTPGEGLPSTQSNRFVTATFISLTGGWSIQNAQSSVIGAPPSFTGNFLYPSTWWSSFEIEFHQPVTHFGFDFMTGDVASEYDTPSTVRITAHTNTLSSPPVGFATAKGDWTHGAYPDGHIEYASPTPFTLATVDIVPGGVVSGLLFVDNLLIQRAQAESFQVTGVASPSSVGLISGNGSYAAGTMATLIATPSPGFDFVDWTENGSVVETSATYTFTVLTNRNLIAQFAPHSPPVALGGTFYQLVNSPLAIAISDLMALDYAPNGEPVFFAGVSSTTLHGLPLTTNDTHIFMPANSINDQFTYTIQDWSGATSTGIGEIRIIARADSRLTGLDVSSFPGGVLVSGIGIPWYDYELSRSTNLAFSATSSRWPVKAGADGLISLRDDFNDLPNPPSQAFYQLRSIR